MARKKEPEKPANHERWLVSYGDLLTLLFAVFVTLYSMSQSDKKKTEEVAESYRKAFGVTKGTPTGKPSIINQAEIISIPTISPEHNDQSNTKTKDISGKSKASHKEFKDILINIEKFLITKNASDRVNIEITQYGLVISLNETGFFDSGSATIKPQSYEILSKIAESISCYSNNISLEGHTDNVPIRSKIFQSNWELSTARATNIAHLFIEQYDFPPQKITVMGHSEFRPIADNNTEEGRRRNRRVDIVLIGESTNESEGPYRGLLRDMKAP